MFAHLFGDDRARYRGALVRVQGRLRLLREMALPPTLQGLDDDLTKLYEGWIFIEGFGENPICVVFSVLPPDLAPAETLDRWVSAEGFFFKRYRYAAKDGWRDAPLLIGKTLTGATPPTRSGSSLWNMPAAAVTGVLIVVGLTVLAAAAVVWWFRRQDRMIRSQVAQTLDRRDQWPADEPGPSKSG
jgi:hypothetical protein